MFLYHPSFNKVESTNDSEDDIDDDNDDRDDDSDDSPSDFSNFDMCRTYLMQSSSRIRSLYIICHVSGMSS